MQQTGKILPNPVCQISVFSDMMSEVSAFYIWAELTNNNFESRPSLIAKFFLNTSLFIAPKMLFHSLYCPRLQMRFLGTEWHSCRMKSSNLGCTLLHCRLAATALILDLRQFKTEEGGVWCFWDAKYTPSSESSQIQQELGIQGYPHLQWK